MHRIGATAAAAFHGIGTCVSDVIFLDATDSNVENVEHSQSILPLTETSDESVEEVAAPISSPFRSSPGSPSGWYDGGEDCYGGGLSLDYNSLPSILRPLCVTPRWLCVGDPCDCGGPHRAHAQGGAAAASTNALAAAARVRHQPPAAAFESSDDGHAWPPASAGSEASPSGNAAKRLRLPSGVADSSTARRCVLPVDSSTARRCVLPVAQANSSSSVANASTADNSQNEVIRFRRVRRAGTVARSVTKTPPRHPFE